MQLILQEIDDGTSSSSNLDEGNTGWGDDGDNGRDRADGDSGSNSGASSIVKGANSDERMMLHLILCHSLCALFLYWIGYIDYIHNNNSILDCKFLVKIIEEYVISKTNNVEVWSNYTNQ